MDHAAQARQHRRNLVRLEPDDHDILDPERRRIFMRGDLHAEGLRRAGERQSALAHGLQVRAARHHPGLEPGAREVRGDHAANRAGADYADLHAARRGQAALRARFSALHASSSACAERFFSTR